MNPHAFARGTNLFRPWGKRVGLFKIVYFFFRIITLLKRIYHSYVVWYIFDSRAIVGNNCLLAENSYVQNNGSRENIKLRDNVVCRGILVAEYGGKIDIGHHVYIGDNTILSAYDEISIGDNVLISHGVHIFDNDSHPKDAVARELHFHAILEGIRYQVRKDSMGFEKITIGNNVWIGFNSIILKGVTIGEGSIIGCGTVVTQDIPPYSVVVGQKAITRVL